MDQFKSCKEDIEQSLSVVSVFLLLNAVFFPKFKVLSKRLILDPEKLNYSQLFSNQVLIKLRLHVLKHKLFSAAQMRGNQGVNSPEMKPLILALVQSKWKAKTIELYERIFPQIENQI